MNILDKKFLCPAPFTGLTINPQGHIVLCCASYRVPIAHMNNIESLESVYNSSQMQYYRDAFYNNKEQEVLKNECQACRIKAKWGLRSRMDILRDTDRYVYNNINKDYMASNEGWNATNKTIRYLEFTTSNICNQSCAMCGPDFSSKWVSIERGLGNDVKNYVMPDDNIQQIIDVLPGLEYLTIKGGEPFADENNLKILTELNKVNSTCAVMIVSNCSNITDNMLEVLKERATFDKPVKVVASVDGIDDLYYWIRSTDFNTTLETLEKIYIATKQPIIINITISLYNIYNILEIFEFFYDKPYIQNIGTNWVVVWPRYASPSMLQPEEIEQIKTNILTRIEGQTEFGDMFYGIDTNRDNTNNMNWMQNAVKSYFSRTGNARSICDFSASSKVIQTWPSHRLLVTARSNHSSADRMLPRLNERIILSKY